MTPQEQGALQVRHSLFTCFLYDLPASQSGRLQAGSVMRQALARLRSGPAPLAVTARSELDGRLGRHRRFGRRIVRQDFRLMRRRGGYRIDWQVRNLRLRLPGIDFRLRVRISGHFRWHRNRAGRFQGGLGHRSLLSSYREPAEAARPRHSSCLRHSVEKAGRAHASDNGAVRFPGHGQRLCPMCGTCRLLQQGRRRERRMRTCSGLLQVRFGAS